MVIEIRSRRHGEKKCFTNFPSMPKRDIVGKLVVIDINLRIIPKEKPRSP